MKKIALISANVVKNIIEWDEISSLSPYSDYIQVDVTNVSCGPGFLYDGTNFSSPAALPLNQQYSPQQYGQYLISQLEIMNDQRGLTSAQKLSMANSFAGFFILLQTGALQSFLDNIPSISIDGVIITNALISYFQAALQNYLNGD